MDYTIMSLHGPDDEYVLSLLKHGNEYKVILFESDTANYKGWDYSTMDDALKAFNRGAEVIAKGEGIFDYKCLRIANTPAK